MDGAVQDVLKRRGEAPSTTSHLVSMTLVWVKISWHCQVRNIQQILNDVIDSDQVSHVS